MTPELIELLEYIEHTTQYGENRSSNKKIRKIQERVSQIKLNEEMGVRYMQAWEEKVMEREEGRKEGFAEAMKLIEQLNRYLLQEKRYDDLEKATNDSEYRKKLMEQYGILAKDIV